MLSRALHLQGLHGQKRCSPLPASYTPAGHCMFRAGGWGPVQGDSLLQLGAAHALPALTGAAAPSDRQQAAAGTQARILDGQESLSKQAARTLMPPQPPAGQMQHLRAAAGVQAGQVGCLPLCCSQSRACEGPQACTARPRVPVMH